MSDELKEKIELLEEKVNEIILCLEENNLFRKIPIDYLEEEEGEEENTD